MSLQKTTAPNTQMHDEMIMVVKRTDLFPVAAWQGINNTETVSFLKTVKEKHCFMPRSLMETDPTYKQIIPYVIFCHEGTYFLMQRQSNSTEQRLASKMTLGIGGHLREEDIQEADIIGWARREFHEEVSYSGSFEVEMLGILNDDSNAVGEVHVGIVMLLKGDSANISVKSELKSGRLVSLEECKEHSDNLESWSKMVVDALCNPSIHF